MYDLRHALVIRRSMIRMGGTPLGPAPREPHTLVALAFAALLAGVALADDPVTPALRVLVKEHYAAGRYLAAVRALESAEDTPSNLQFRSDMLAAVGDTQGALAAHGGGEAPARRAGRGLRAGAPEDAIDAIVSAARGRRVVILNEAHHVPRHRAFALALARALRVEGFDTFAAEDFETDAPLDEVSRRGYPTRSDGYYLREPLFGDLVRQAARLGYRLVAYESRTPAGFTGSVEDSIRRREVAQADLLVSRVLRPHPQARLFVYCGYSHAREDDDASGWMATRLRLQTGIDPLTIDQTAQGEPPPRARPSADWAFALARGWLGGPVIVRSPDGVYVGGVYAGAVDLQVFHAPTSLVQGRPDWLAMDGYRAPVPIPAALVADDVLVQAFVSHEGEDAIPMDQVVIQGGPPVLMLPRGSYRLVSQDAAGKELHRMQIER